VKLVAASLVKGRPVILICLIAIVIVSIYALFFSPLINELKVKSHECLAIETKLQAVRQALATSSSVVSILPEKPGSPLSLNLSGIFWDEQAPQAIINEKIVGIGDRVRGITVVEIKDDRVILNDGEKNIELKMTQEFTTAGEEVD
jgi:hypothetical protein